MTASLVIIGSGPKGVGLLERVVANAPELLLGGRRLMIHLIDPFPPGAGRVWRFAQSPLLRMNSMPEDVTVFTDDTVRCAGPIRPGPTLAEWVTGVRDGTIAVDLDREVRAEVHTVTATTFPTRRLQSAYLAWFFDQVCGQAPASVRIVVHADRAVDVREDADGRQQVWLAGGAEPLSADLVVLALGHLDAAPGGREAEFAAFAERHGAHYVPPAYTADLDLSAVPAGEPVLVQGFGLAFVDLVVLLTEGRGGRFVPDGERLRYLPSGREPVLHVGSRRGVPYHAKPEYRLVADPAPLPRFFGPDQVAQLAARPGRLDFRADVWPLMAKDIAWGYYHELFVGHPDRVRVPFAEFADRFAALDWGSAELAVLVAAAVPDEEDRLDLDAFDRPMRDRTFADRDAVTAWVTEHVRADLARRADQRFSADLGAFLALLSVFGQLGPLVAAGKLTADAQLDEVDGWWFGFFSFYASGPPGHRLRELLALVAAGLVRPIGPDTAVCADERLGAFVARSPAVPGSVTARTLVDARLPAPSVGRATDPLLRALSGRGELTEERLPGSTRGTGRIHTTAEGNLVDAAGRAHPRRFAVGPHTSHRSPGAFTRPRTNAVGFRHNDALARRLLTDLTDHKGLESPVSTIAAIAGSPSATSRTVALVELLAERLRVEGHEVRVLPVRALPGEALLGADVGDPAVAAAVTAVAEADGLIVGSPVYKASFSGVLKVFLDLLPQSALAGKAVLPLLTGGAPTHALALDFAFKPVLAALGARHVVPGAFLLDKQIERTPEGAVLGADADTVVKAALAEFTAALAGDRS